ncbi:MAG: hypothetical protein JWM28_791 [Chitinophagaceae bacterium]|nr:hypothetical protein [Chitinophagaceae bacterium]
MKQLFFAGSFAIAVFFAYGVKSSTLNSPSTRTAISFQSPYDTLPKSKKDSLNKKKYWGKDSTMKRDSLRPQRDTTSQ